MAGDWMPCYRIVDGERYEVNANNGVWRLGQDKRAGPIPHIRSKVNGHAWGPGYRAFLQVAGRKHAAMCFGVFHKLLELAANQPRELRWALLDHQGVPFTPPTIASAIGFAKRDIERALQVLADVRVVWIELGEWNVQSREFRGIPRKSREIPFRSGQDIVRTVSGSTDVFDPTKVPLPTELDTPKFRKTWLDFCEHRRTSKTHAKHPLTELGVTRTLNRCRRWGEAKAIVALDTAIENDWRGPWEPRKGDVPDTEDDHGLQRLA